MIPAFACRCPDADCSGWRQTPRHGGGHITRDRAMALLRKFPVPSSAQRKSIEKWAALERAYKAPGGRHAGRKSRASKR